MPTLASLFPDKNADQKRLELRFEDLGFAHDVPLLGHYHYAHAGNIHDGHTHDAMEIHYVVRGSPTYRVEGHNYHPKAGDVILTFPGELHDTGDRPEEKGIMFWLQVRLPARADRFLLLPADQAQLLIDSLRHIERRCFRGTRDLGKAFEKVCLAYHQPHNPLRQLAVATLLVDLLLAIVQSAQEKSRFHQSDDIRQVLARIDGCRGEWPTVPDLAEAVNLSPSWFKAKFRAQVGVPPAEYLLRHKVERAKAILAGGGHTVTEVAFLLGFSSSQYFATAFRRFTGMTPRDYQRSLPER